MFPPALLEEIQRYVQGACVYIPRVGTRKRKPNGLRLRNAEICRRYADGQPVRSLSEEYCLSPQAIYKILAAGRRQQQGDGDAVLSTFGFERKNCFPFAEKGDMLEFRREGEMI